jgi:hypothetical protein
MPQMFKEVIAKQLQDIADDLYRLNESDRLGTVEIAIGHVREAAYRLTNGKCSCQREGEMYGSQGSASESSS